jgi:glycosyltransferase involved in cell wall biosynthesis
MPELYRAADIFTIASLKEMMAVVMLEAIGSGLPAVVHRHPVHEWMVGPGGCAIDMEAPGELASTLATLCSDADLRSRLCILARQQAVSQFSTGQIVGQILDYYERILAPA